MFKREFLEIRTLMWMWIRTKTDTDHGIILPRWARLCRALLYPIDTFYWKMSKTRGYDWETDTWFIAGQRFNGFALLSLAQSDGELFRVTKEHGRITLTRVRLCLRVGGTVLDTDTIAKMDQGASRNDHPST